MEYFMNILLLTLTTFITFSLNAMELNEKDKNLFKTIESRNSTSISSQIDKGANPNAAGYNGCTKTVLMYAASKQYNSNAILQVLIEKGARANAATTHNCSCSSNEDHPAKTTVLHYIARNGHDTMIEALPNSSANIDVNAKDINDESPITLAARFGHVKTVYLILSRWNTTVIPDKDYNWAQWLVAMQTNTLEVDERNNLANVSKYFFTRGLLDFRIKK
jgi:ankyrin repeat protein